MQIYLIPITHLAKSEPLYREEEHHPQTIGHRRDSLLYRARPSCHRHHHVKSAISHQWVARLTTAIASVAARKDSNGSVKSSCSLLTILTASSTTRTWQHSSPPDVDPLRARQSHRLLEKMRAAWTEICGEAVLVSVRADHLDHHAEIGHAPAPCVFTANPFLNLRGRVAYHRSRATPTFSLSRVRQLVQPLHSEYRFVFLHRCFLHA